MVSNRYEMKAGSQWEGDADPANHPTYPMRQHVAGEPRGMTWDAPPQQPETVEILSSIERPRLASVFGTAVPPSGLSGIIRRIAFRYSESSWYRWVPLMAADRIQMLEGILSDLLHLRIPNLPAELGWRSEWRYKPFRLIFKITVFLAVIAGLVWLLTA